MCKRDSVVNVNVIVRMTGPLRRSMVLLRLVIRCIQAIGIEVTSRRHGIVDIYIITFRGDDGTHRQDVSTRPPNRPAGHSAAARHHPNSQTLTGTDRAAVMLRVSATWPENGENRTRTATPSGRPGADLDGRAGLYFRAQYLLSKSHIDTWFCDSTTLEQVHERVRYPARNWCSVGWLCSVLVCRLRDRGRRYATAYPDRGGPETVSAGPQICRTRQVANRDQQWQTGQPAVSGGIDRMAPPPATEGQRAIRRY